MKQFTALLIATCCILIANISNATNYTSAAAGPANWNLNTSWIPNGIPTSTDNVTISAGHTITISSSGCICKNLVVNGTLNLISNTLVVSGNYSVSGSETGSGTILFNSNTTSSFTITGSVSTSSNYSINTNATVTAGSTLNKSVGSTTLAINKSFTNLGTCTFNTFTGKAGSTFINSLNATLTLQKVGFMVGANFTASASGNTVNLKYATGAIPTTTSGYYKLTLSSSVAGTKTLPANTIVANNLTMSAGNHLNSNSFDLTVGGNWANSATFTATTGNTVTLNGTAAQTMSNSSGTTTFTNLTINNTSTGVTLTSGTYILSEVLTVSNGTFNTGGRTFTMTSDAARTARIAPISGTGAIAGNFIIQRFVTARDTSWADFSSPVQNSTFLDWDNELPAVYYGYAPPTQYPTQYTYDEAADDYSPVTSSGTALTPGLGFEVFLSADFNYSDFAATTINTIGVPNQGDQHLSSLVSFNGAGSNLVGNPFASSISWSSVLANSSGLYDYFEMYDYTIGDYNGFTSGSGVEIGATQGFWVYADGGALSLNIPESAKTVSSNSSIKAHNTALPYFTLKMTGTNNLSHTLKVTSSDVASDGWDNNDIPYRRSPNKTTPVFASIAGGKKQTINVFNSSDDIYAMPLVTEVSSPGNYSIEAAGFDYVSEYKSVILEDKLLNKKIDLTHQNVYTFKMNSTDKNDRFVVYFSKEASNSSQLSDILTQSFADQVEITPTSEGNQVSFNLSELTNSKISVTNVIGQDIVEPISVPAQSQSVNISLPSDYSGLYLIKIESTKGTVTKKYIRK
jgi:hypothetical protein